MLAILKPFVLSALKSPKFKTFVVELLEKLVEQSDNQLDDKALAIVKKGLNVIVLPLHEVPAANCCLEGAPLF